MTAMLEAAERMAAEAHLGQLDKQGAPYIHHPIAVAHLVTMLGGSEYQVAAALLHDVVEDGRFDLDDIADDFPVAVVEMVSDLTRPPDVGYLDYIRGLRGTPAALVKLADLTHNMDPTRGPVPLSLRNRYGNAVDILLGRLR